MKRGVWFQIHWLLSVALGVAIAIVCVTGAALSFRVEISEALNKEVMFVEPSAEAPMAMNELLEKLGASLNDSRINSITLYKDPSRSARVGVGAAGSANMRGRAQYVNPYTAEMLPSESLRGDEFFSLMIRWHRWLGDPSRSWGKQAVAIATIALIVITITGLVVYFPFMKRNFYSSLTIDFKKKGRGFLYKLHSVFGVWTLIFVLLMSFTGLWWSYDWYRNGLYLLAGVERPTMQRARPNAENQARDATRSNVASGASQTETSGAINAATQNARGANESGRDQESATRNIVRTSADYLALSKAYDMFRSETLDNYKSVTISFPQPDVKLFNVNWTPPNPAHSRASNQLVLDVEKGEVVRRVQYDDRTLGEKFISGIFPLHSGDFFGVTGLILYCVSSLAVALFVITGYMLYYERFVRERNKKRKKSRDGANAGVAVATEANPKNDVF
ncbi:MAG: PepSY domain-containing protein [Helicobacteraceae bacterium]|jgi:sulfite reductase (NADPH) flavoprotein alpha-component|nr:PepSY domain-containing protein [Helicobacteraceae bacterium]